MYLTLYTEDFFNAAHFLKGYDGKCSELHGHSWKVCVWIQGEDSQKNSVGLLWDFNNLKALINEFDHKNLNEVFKENPSVENLARHAYKKFKDKNPELKFKVRIYESITKKESYCETGDF
jgi:6-pyruvoyltetrahydropterin/6-carboxytetrahydropterin synthase